MLILLLTRYGLICNLDDILITLLNIRNTRFRLIMTKVGELLITMVTKRIVNYNRDDIRLALRIVLHVVGF